MKRAGLTIIEVLIALAIIGVLLAFVATTQVSTFRITTKSQKASIATQAAIKEMTSLTSLVLGVHQDSTTQSTVSNFASFYDGNCATAGVACTGTLAQLAQAAQQAQASVDPQLAQLFTVPNGVTGSYSISGPTGASPTYAEKGIVTITVTIAEPAAMTMETAASCVDQQLYPTVLDPTSCEF